MKNRFKKVIYFVFLLIFLSSFLNSPKYGYGEKNVSLVPSGSILIENDADFISYGFPGNGDASNPFRIENLEINTTDQAGIYITGTTDHFIIQNCEIQADAYGIFIESVASGTATVFNNLCVNSMHGILSWSNDQIVIANNTCNNNNGYGIQVEFSSKPVIANNSCSHNTFGTLIIGCSSSEIANNTFIYDGFEFFSGNLDNLVTTSFYNNKANNKPIGWFTNIDDGVFNESNYGQLFLINCSRAEISNQIIQGAITCISLFYCKNATVFDNTVENHDYEGKGIVFNDSPNANITNNSCNYFEHGISIQESDLAKMENNNIKNCAFGIYVNSCDNIAIHDNIIGGFIPGNTYSDGIQVFGGYLRVYNNLFYADVVKSGANALLFI